MLQSALGRRISLRKIHEDAHAPQCPGLLRIYRQSASCRHSADKCNQLAPSHALFPRRQPRFPCNVFGRELCRLPKSQCSFCVQQSRAAHVSHGSWAAVRPGPAMLPQRISNRTLRRPTAAMSRRSKKIAYLFDHLVGSTEQRKRKCQTKCPRGFEIEHKLNFRGLLDRQVGRFLAFENASRIVADQAVSFP